MNDGAALRAALARLRDLLARSGEAHWSNLVTEALKQPDDKMLARSVQTWFAGPGGLNGLVLSPAGGHAVATCAIDAVNRAFIALRRDAFQLSWALCGA